MKNYAIEFESVLFGRIKVAVTGQDIISDDVWVDLNDLISVNIFPHPDDEGKEDALGMRWFVSVWTNRSKDGFVSFGSEIESVYHTEVTIRIIDDAQ
jgi:hypothetical protein